MLKPSRLALACALAAAAPPARAEEILAFAPGLTVRADRIDRDPQAQRLYLPALPNDALVVPQQLAQLAQGAAGDSAKLAIHGSNTIGSALMGSLIKAYALANNADTTEEETGKDEKKISVIAAGGAAPVAEIELFSKGSGTAFVDLASGAAALGMSSRQVKDDENEKLKAANLGDFRQPEREFVIARDGLKVIVNRANPNSGLTLDQIAQIFSGEITDWGKIDPQRNFAGPIKVYARDEKSGTWSTFNDLVLAPGKRALRAAERFQDSRELADKVGADPLAIGFIAGAFSDNAKALAVVGECGIPSVATDFAIKTEEYALSRKLFLYSPSPAKNPLAAGIIEFAKSRAAQPVVTAAEFVNSDVITEPFEAQAQRMAQIVFAAPANARDAAKYLQDLRETQKFVRDVRFARRMSLTFHFGEGKADLNSSASQDDLARLDALLRDPAYQAKKFLIIGFSSDKDGGKDGGKALSEQRASNVATMLIDKYKATNVFRDNVRAYGMLSPVSCSADRNQRVEIWVEN